MSRLLLFIPILLASGALTACTQPGNPPAQQAATGQPTLQPGQVQARINGEFGAFGTIVRR